MVISPWQVAWLSQYNVKTLKDIGLGHTKISINKFLSHSNFFSLLEEATNSTVMVEFVIVYSRVNSSFYNNTIKFVKPYKCQLHFLSFQCETFFIQYFLKSFILEDFHGTK